mmetsp:Transcript_58873/g.170281  ORF Transcript_58873/g.170281 Transcript_58873/m.170281 type:complete len:243 (-) Transcript_58873:878-1606(-)
MRLAATWPILSPPRCGKARRRRTTLPRLWKAGLRRRRGPVSSAISSTRSCEGTLPKVRRQRRTAATTRDTRRFAPPPSATMPSLVARCAPRRSAIARSPIVWTPWRRLCTATRPRPGPSRPWRSWTSWTSSAPGATTRPAPAASWNPGAPKQQTSGASARRCAPCPRPTCVGRSARRNGGSSWSGCCRAWARTAAGIGRRSAALASAGGFAASGPARTTPATFPLPKSDSRTPSSRTSGGRR